MQPQRMVEILAKEEPGVQGPGEVAGGSGYPSWGDEERCEHSMCKEGKAGADLTKQEGLTGRK